MNHVGVVVPAQMARRGCDSGQSTALGYGQRSNLECAAEFPRQRRRAALGLKSRPKIDQLQYPNHAGRRVFKNVRLSKDRPALNDGARFGSGGGAAYDSPMSLFGRPSAEDQRRADAWRDWLRNRNPFAIASLVLGIFSLIELGALLIFGIGGVALGFIALRQLSGDGASPPYGRRLAWTGIVLSAASLIIAAVLYFAPRHPR
jgi:hypothetical protein